MSVNKNRSFYLSEIYKYENSYFWYRIRRELVVDILKNLSSDRNKLLLDIGSGTASNVREFSKFAKTVGIDIDIQFLRFAKKEGKISTLFLSANALYLPFKNEIFDIVTALDVIEHIDNDLAVLFEINRILKHGGKLIITVPALKKLWSNFDEKVGHLRRYSKSELCEKIKKTGFRVDFSSYFFMITVPILYLVRMREKRPGDVKIVHKVNPILNEILYRYFKFEILLMKIFRLPFGSSLIAVATKINTKSYK